MRNKCFLALKYPVFIGHGFSGHFAMYRRVIVFTNSEAHLRFICDQSG